MLKTEKNRRQNARSGPISVRIRFYPPTITEAVAAARDLADDLHDQVEIAAGLMGIEEENDRTQVEEEVARMNEIAIREAEKEKSGAQMTIRARNGTARTVTVERTGRSKSIGGGRPGRAVVVERAGRFASAPNYGRLALSSGKVRTFDLTRRGQN